MVRLRKSSLWVRLFFVLMVGGLVPQSVQAATTNGVQDAIQATVQVVTYSRLNRANGSGSGSLINAAGWVLTNYHVIEGNQQREDLVSVRVPRDARSGEYVEYWATVVTSDPDLDLALLQLVASADGEPLTADAAFPFVPLGDSDGLKPGDEIYALGYPDISFEQLVLTKGLVSGFFSEAGLNWILSDAVISQGNSGGMVVNEQGELVAVPTAVVPGEDSHATMAYLRPINDARGLLNAIESAEAATPTDDAAAQEGQIAEIQRTEPTFQDDFQVDDGTWFTFRNKDAAIAYRARRLQLQVKTPDKTVYATNETLNQRPMADFFLTVEAKPLALPVDGSFGVRFRMVDQANFYLFLLSQQGYYSLGRVIDDEYTVLIKWQQSPMLRRLDDTSERRIGLLARGTQFTLLVNDNVLAQAKDATFTDGTLALTAGVGDEAGIEVAFDNLSLWSLAGSGSTSPTFAIQNDDSLAERVAAIQATEPLFVADLTRDEGKVDDSSDADVSRTYSPDGLSIRIKATELSSWSNANVSVDDFLLETALTFTAGDDQAAYGVNFRYVDGDNFYNFVIRPEGRYSLWKLENDEWQTLIDWSESAAIKTGIGATNHLFVLAEGRQITLVINGVKVAEMKDGTFGGGRVALAADSSTQGGDAAVFHTLKVWEIAP